MDYFAVKIPVKFLSYDSGHFFKSSRSLGGSPYLCCVLIRRPAKRCWCLRDCFVRPFHVLLLVGEDQVSVYSAQSWQSLNYARLWLRSMLNILNSEDVQIEWHRCINNLISGYFEYEAQHVISYNIEFSLRLLIHRTTRRFVLVRFLKMITAFPFTKPFKSVAAYIGHPGNGLHVTVCATRTCFI